MGLKYHFSQWKIYFSQFIFIDKYLIFKEIEYFIHYIKFTLFYVNSLYFFMNVNLGCASNFFTIHKRVENWSFWIQLTFIFCQIVMIRFQAWYVSRRGGANLWLNGQFSRNEMFIFMQQFCVSLSDGNTNSKINWG